MRTLKIGLPIAMKHTPDYEHTSRADLYQPIAYPKPDGVISFDRLTSVAFSYTNHAEDQPCHLQLGRSAEHTSELQSLMRISYAVFCLKKKTNPTSHNQSQLHTH